MKKYIFICLIFCLETANANFVGDYDVSKWTEVSDGGSIDTSNAPNSITITGHDITETSPGIPADISAATGFFIQASSDGTVTFDWSFTSQDIDGSLADFFSWILITTPTQLTIADESLFTQSGSESFAVMKGDTFGFNIFSDDSKGGSASVTISNFTAPVPVPAAAWLFGSGLIGLIGMRRKITKIIYIFSLRPEKAAKGLVLTFQHF